MKGDFLMEYDVSVVVPCYNEQDTINAFYQEVTHVLDKIGCSYEILFVDDGSKDQTKIMMQNLAENNNKVHYMSFSKNFGKEGAMYAGFCNANGKYVAVMDADMQDPPTLLPEMLRIIEEENYDCVATRRINRQGEGVLKSFFSKIFYKIINCISDADIVDGARDFRLMKKEMVDVIVEMSERNRFSKGIFGWIGFKCYWLPYKNQVRIAGKSKWNMWGLFKYAIDGIINFSQLPLTIASWFGIFMTCVSFIVIIFIAVRKILFGDPVAGWPSLVCIITLIGGIQLFCMGIMGQYISKMYIEIKQRPHYIIKDTNLKDIAKIR